MIAEYDDMVGVYLDTLKETGLEKDTIVILTSDHGEMLMEKRQWYKMSAYEGSTRVPCVFAGPGVTHRGNVATLGSLVDLMPTILDMAGIPLLPDLDGTSLVPLLTDGDARSDEHPDHIVSQFHGENLAMSWYMVRQADMKYIVWGTGQEHIPQLFNLTADPHENQNLYDYNDHYRSMIPELDALLRETIDYPNVSLAVAKYNQEMARWWMGQNPDSWPAILNGTAYASHAGKSQQCLANHSTKCPAGSDWGEVWQVRNADYLDAWNDWLNSEPKVVPCPSNLTYNWD